MNGETPLFDGLGSERTVTNSSQTVTGTLTSEAFGQTVATSGSSSNPYMFAATSGYRNDGDAGLSHVGARYYDASVGRFLSRDPIQDGYNWYPYCDNDPVNAVDPNGLEDRTEGTKVTEVGPGVVVNMLPGGLATGFASVLCGRILNGPRAKVDPRLLILFGLVTFMVSMWDLGHLTTGSGVPYTRLALIVRGFGLGFLFTPINLAAFNSLKGAEIAQGSGMVNLTRQLGGSFGIAIIGTYLTNHASYHRAMLATHLYAGNPAVEQRQQAIIANLIAHGYAPAAARSASLGFLRQAVGVQAQTMAFNDAFLLILAVFVFVAPAVFLLRRPKNAGAPAGAGH